MEVIKFEMGNKTKLGKIIDKYNLSQKELADFVDVTPASVNRWCNVVNGKATQFEYKLIPDIINFFRQNGLNVHPNELLDLEQYGIERPLTPIKGIIKKSDQLVDDKMHFKNEIFIHHEVKYHEPNWQMIGDFYLIEERKNTNHLLLYIVDNGTKYKPDDNRIIDVPGVIFFGYSDLYTNPVMMHKITRNGDKLNDESYITSINTLSKHVYKMDEIDYIQKIVGVMYSK